MERPQRNTALRSSLAVSTAGRAKWIEHPDNKQDLTTRRRSANGGPGFAEGESAAQSEASSLLKLPVLTFSTRTSQPGNNIHNFQRPSGPKIFSLFLRYFTP